MKVLSSVENSNSNLDLNFERLNSIETKLEGVSNKVSEFSSAFKREGGKPSKLFDPVRGWRKPEMVEAPMRGGMERRDSGRNRPREQFSERSDFMSAILHNQEMYDHGICFFYDNGRLVRKTVFCEYLRDGRTSYSCKWQGRMIPFEEFFNLMADNGLVIGKNNLLAALRDHSYSRSRSRPRSRPSSGNSEFPRRFRGGRQGPSPRN